MTTLQVKWVRLGILAVVAILGISGLASAGIMPDGLAQAISGVGMVCTYGPVFDFEATSGYISTPDGNSVFMWGYTLEGSTFQMPGPVLCVNEGDTVTVNLLNNLPDPPGSTGRDNVSIVFPGQSDVTSTGGIAGLFVDEAIPGGTISYSFTASEPGTYLYESGTNPHKQVHMGLYGVLVVRPAMGADYAYNDASTQFDTSREYLIVLHDIDPALHFAVQRGRRYDVNLKHDRYWTVNGRSFPDTALDNFVVWLPNQPYGALVQVEPYDAGSNPLPALIRYANAGLANHPFHPHGNHLRTIARDGRLLQGPGGEDASVESFTRTIASGQTYDLLFRFFNVEGWNTTGNPVPVEIPGLQNLVFKDGLTFYSGSPYLGESGDFPPGTTS